MPADKMPARTHVSVPLPLIVVVVATAAAIAAVVVPNVVNAVQRGRQKRTMGDIRAVATAIEEYWVKAGSYPVTPGQGMVSVEVLAPTLEPTYARRLPRTDGWGAPIEVRSTATEYTVLSHGRDRSADGADVPAPSASGGTHDFRNDIVLSAGSFVQYPEGTMR